MSVLSNESSSHYLCVEVTYSLVLSRSDFKQHMRN